MLSVSSSRGLLIRTSITTCFLPFVFAGTMPKKLPMRTAGGGAFIFRFLRVHTSRFAFRFSLFLGLALRFWPPDAGLAAVIIYIYPDKQMISHIYCL